MNHPHLSVQPKPQPVRRSAGTAAPAGPAQSFVARGWLPATAIIVWGIVCALLSLRVFVANLLVWRIRRMSYAAEPMIAARCAVLARTLQVRAPQVRRSGRIAGPCLVGWLRPAILLPADGPPVTDDVLIHELAHLRRGDCAWQLFSRLAVAVLWFQPLLWWLVRELERVADEVCDDYVVALGGDRCEYAERLLKLAETFQFQWATGGAVVSVVSLKSLLARRITRIVDSSRALATQTRHRVTVAIGLLLAAVVIGGALVSVERAASGQAVQKTEGRPAAVENTEQAPAASNSGQRNETASEQKLATLTGKVVDQDGKPIAGAQVLVIRKTWRTGYRQEGFEGKTNDEGRYEFPDLYTLGEPRAILVTIVRPGYALTGIYHENTEKDPLPDETLKLLPATKVNLRLKDAQGQPLKAARLYPEIRTAADGSNHLIYFNTADRVPSLWTQTDEQGRATLALFRPNDKAQIGIATSGGPRVAKFDVGEGGDIDVVVPDPPPAAPRASPPRPPQGAKAKAEDAARVAWVAQHAIELKSIDPADTEFADLEPMKKLIGDARIVMLGEQSHGDGATFHTKTRLIKFLHERMGFDVLVFESGLYDCNRAWQAFKKGRPPLEAARLGVFGIWSESEQMQPLFAYVAQRAKTDRPLELAGFDDQMTGLASQHYLLRDVRDLAAELGPSAVDAETLTVLTESITSLQKHTPLGDRLEAFRAACTKMQLACGAAADRPPHAGEWRLFAQYFRSLPVYAEQVALQPRLAHGRPVSNLDQESLVKIGNLREAQSADNLAWLAETAYPKRKLIVWAASSHISATHEVWVNPPNNQNRSLATHEVWVNPPSNQNRSLGELLRSHIDARDIFSVAFTAYEGQRGTSFTPDFELAKANPGSLEDICQRTGKDNLIVGLRDLGEDGRWLAEPLQARPLGYVPTVTNWSKAFDAFVFNRTMYPSTKLAPAAAK
jgi:erythromycin esterase-like protein/beta-lactamase regulating signal transducer with metallopeptidase domain